MLLILDTHALLHRAYHALPHLTSPSGQPVNAVYGIASMLLRLIEEFSPTFLLAAHDRPEPSFRHQEYVGYQVKRQRADDDLIAQIEPSYELLRSFGIPLLSYPGFEADDIIGTLVARFSAKAPKRQGSKVPIVIVTGDRDLTQLVTNRVKLYMPVKGMAQARLVGPLEVEDMLGVRPDQVVDYKALVGDSSDNYPGVPGVGPVSATRLLAAHQTLDNIYTHLSDITPISLQAKLTESREAAYLSRRLAALDQDAPLGDFHLSPFVFSSTTIATVQQFFRQMGFRSLAERLAGIQKQQVRNQQTKLF